MNVSDVPKTNSRVSLKYYVTLWKVANVRKIEIKYRKFRSKNRYTAVLPIYKLAFQV